MIFFNKNSNFGYTLNKDIMEAKQETTNWRQIVLRYAKPNPVKSWLQIADALIPYLLLWYLMVKMFYKYPYWVILLMSLVAAGFLVRLFIIFHDCGHGAFFKSPVLNRIVGILLGFLSFTPFHKWTYEHKIHHQTVGNLDKKGIGDVLTMTVDEYKNASKFQRFMYRLIRNPFFLFFFAAFLNFLILNKIPKKHVSKKYNFYAVLTLIAEILVFVLFGYLIGWKRFLLIQLPILYFASIFGIYLFYVQHQYDGVVWERNENWDYARIAMDGSSYLKLNPVLQYFSGNIGFHHIHHLSPKIPNYNLEKCMRENVLFQKKPLTVRQSIKDMKLKLWDEKKKKLVTYKEALNR